MAFVRTRPVGIGGTACLALALLFAATACDRRPPVDPEAMAAVVGKRAFEFYRLINEGQVYQAGLFLSAGQRARVADPLDDPLIRGKVDGTYDKVLAGRVTYDYKRRDVATIEATLHRSVSRTGIADTLVPVGRQVHRWVREQGSWFYDGPVAAQ